jgi:hypothetical protein
MADITPFDKLLFSFVKFLQQTQDKFREIIREKIGPRDFAWKVRRRIRYDRNELFIIFADKLRIKEYAGTLGIKTAPLLFVTKNPETIPFDSLPANYFIKANHASGWNLVCLNSKLYHFGNGSNLFGDSGVFQPCNSAHQISRSQCIDICKKWLQEKYSREEWAYHEIDPHIIVEELLESEKHEELKDYRLYTFNGVVKCISIGSPAYRKNKQNVFFNTRWEPFELTKYREVVPYPLPAKPFSLEEMVGVAERIGRGVDFLRVDLFDTNKGVILGEVTIYPEAGHPGTPTHCRIFNTWLSNQWKQTLVRKRSKIPIY